MNKPWISKVLKIGCLQKSAHDAYELKVYILGKNLGGRF